ncbi:MAG TPA: transglycosylase SLT domain-containing protein [Limnobacter sp.]|nr:transglycosylase SLT domain-containing protein [Limnobacter sp.]
MKQKPFIQLSIAAGRAARLACLIAMAGACFQQSALAQDQLSMNTEEPTEQLFGLVSPGLSLKLSKPPELVTLDFAQDSADVWLNMRSNFAVPDIENQDVLMRERALQKNRQMVNDMLKRSEPYIYFITQECEKRGLPAELALIPFIESQFNPHARSPRAAEGLWQFIPSTARQFDLKRNQWVDERRDLKQSTRAALDYLTYLYDMHGDWHLALISYNWGEGSVLKAARKAEEMGLAPILENLDLPAETRQYIPKLQALKNLINEPDRFGITLPKVPNEPYFTVIKRNSDLDLREVARLSGLSLDTFKKLNPGLNQPVLYAAHTPHLLVPVYHADRVLNSLKEYKKSSPQRSYTVRKGDTLIEIAKRFGVAIKDLQAANGMGKKTRLKPGMRLKLPTGGSSDPWSL